MNNDLAAAVAVTTDDVAATATTDKFYMVSAKFGSHADEMNLLIDNTMV